MLALLSMQRKIFLLSPAWAVHGLAPCSCRHTRDDPFPASSSCSLLMGLRGCTSDTATGSPDSRLPSILVSQELYFLCVFDRKSPSLIFNSSFEELMSLLQLQAELSSQLTFIVVV